VLFERRRPTAFTVDVGPGGRAVGSLTLRSHDTSWKGMTISDAQKAHPLAKVALEAHALRYLKARDGAPLDLLARLSGRFAGSPILPPGLIEMRDKSVVLDRNRFKYGQLFIS
jgi:hypothetical protein